MLLEADNCTVIEKLNGKHISIPGSQCDETKRKIHSVFKVMSSEDSTESMSEGVCMIIFHAGIWDP